MSPQSFNLFRLICVFCERSSCHFGPSACLGRSALFFYPSHSPFLVEPIRLISSCYFRLSFILLSSREKRKCSNAWCRCLSRSLLLLPLFVQRQIIHMLNGVVILKRVMKLTKWLISQKHGVVVVIRFSNGSRSLFPLFQFLSSGFTARTCLNDYNLLWDYDVSCILYTILCC